jgi:hypothetical protein
MDFPVLQASFLSEKIFYLFVFAIILIVVNRHNRYAFSIFQKEQLEEVTIHLHEGDVRNVNKLPCTTARLSAQIDQLYLTKSRGKDKAYLLRRGICKNDAQKLMEFFNCIIIACSLYSNKN